MLLLILFPCCSAGESPQGDAAVLAWMESPQADLCWPQGQDAHGMVTETLC